MTELHSQSTYSEELMVFLLIHNITFVPILMYGMFLLVYLCSFNIYSTYSDLFCSLLSQSFLSPKINIRIIRTAG